MQLKKLQNESSKQKKQRKKLHIKTYQISKYCGK